MKKNFKTALAAILSVCSLLNLTGCSGNIGNKGEPANLTLGAEVTKTQYSPITLTDNNTLNSIRLFDAVIADKENAVFSPLSLNMALGLIEAGADGDSKAAISSYLQTENFADFAENYMKLAKEKYTFDSDYDKRKNVLEIANSFWADNALPLKDDYKQSVSGKFDAEIKSAAFADKENTLNAINGWVNDRTHKMIPSILSDYGNETVAVLINTVYFESAWSEEWECGNKKETFTLPDGTEKKIPLMYNSCDSYFENDKATAFGCRYKNGLEFIGILPKETGEFTLESLDIPTLLENKSSSRDYDISAVMPRLNFESAFKLKDALSAAGLDVIFNGERADFSGIADLGLHVSEILQKTKLELDEYGTRASAATAAPFDYLSFPPSEKRTVRLDRPFAFMIYDPDEQQILFVGKVTNP